MSAALKRHPLISFFVLAYAFSWWPWPLYALELSPPVSFGAGPFLAALVVLAIVRGRPGLRGLLSRMARWRVARRCYAVALMLPVALTVAAATLNVMLGASAPSSAELAGWTGLPLTFAALLLIPGIGGAWEEPGFRGYALPRLQSDRSALVASLVLGALWAGWHLPLILAGRVHASDIVLLVGWAIVLTWVFNSTGGSVLIVMLMHAMNNTVSGNFFSRFFTGADSVTYSWLEAVLWWAVALGVAVVAGSEHLSRSRRRQVEPGGAAAADAS